MPQYFEASDYLRQCLLFNGWVLFSIRHQTSGSHLPPSSPPCNQKHWIWALHRTKCGRNMSLESTDFRERTLDREGRWCCDQKAKSHSVAKQTSHIPHLTSKHSNWGSFKLQPAPKCCRVTQFRSTRHDVVKYQTVWNKAVVTLSYSWKGTKWYYPQEVKYITPYLSHCKAHMRDFILYSNGGKDFSYQSLDPRCSGAT